MTLHYYRLRLFENRVRKRNSAEIAENRAVRNIENITVHRKIFGNSKKACVVNWTQQMDAVRCVSRTTWDGG